MDAHPVRWAAVVLGAPVRVVTRHPQITRLLAARHGGVDAEPVQAGVVGALLAVRAARALAARAVGLHRLGQAS